ncbi:MAG: ribosome silencing factor [Thermodesulfovibrio sp.]|nr:ribosome silencing factor [Thermodesulfovibrio sp.]
MTNEGSSTAVLADSRELAVSAAEAALEKKAENPVVLELTGLTVVADYFVVCSGESTTQVRAISEHIEDELRKAGIRPIGIEGRKHGHWVLLDYGDVIVHIFEKETRTFYDLEKLWMDAKTIDLDEDKSDMGWKDKRAVHS